MDQDKVQWRAVVNSVISFGFDKMRAMSWLCVRLLASQEDLCCMGLITYNSFEPW